MPPSRDTLLKTTRTFISHFTQPFPSPSTVLGIRTPDCKHYLGPSIPNLSFASNEESVASWSGVQWAFRDYKFALIDGREPIVDVQARKVVFWVKGTALTVDGPYEHDIVFMLTMNNDGGMIEEIIEICDSAYVKGWMDKFGDEEFRRRSLEWHVKENDERASHLGSLEAI